MILVMEMAIIWWVAIFDLRKDQMYVSSLLIIKEYFAMQFY